jgi:F-type H+-transporting ATPase subunit delta
MDTTLIAKRYAKALLELEGISLDEILSSLKAISDVISSDVRVQEFLKSPIISNTKKFEAVVLPIKDKLDSRVVNLLSLMAQKGRLSLVPQLVELLQKEIQIRNNVFSGTLESGEEIDSTLISKLEKRLSSYSGAQIKLDVKKTELDGVKVEVSDLGLELSFSKEAVRKALFEHIQKAL